MFTGIYDYPCDLTLTHHAQERQNLSNRSLVNINEFKVYEKQTIYTS